MNRTTLIVLLPLLLLLGSCGGAPRLVLDVRAVDYRLNELCLQRGELVVDDPGISAAAALDGRSGISGRSRFALRPDDPRQLRAIAGLLRGDLGALQQCQLEIEWQQGPGVECGWSAQLHVTGQLLSARSWLVDRPRAVELLRAPSSVAAELVVDEELRECITAAERLDWRLLWPGRLCGRAEVVACQFASPARRGSVVTDQVNLVVAIGASPCRDHAVIPAAVMPLLGAVRRDRSTLCGGFSFRVRLRPRMIVADESPGQRLALATPMSLVVRTRHRSWVTGSEPDPVHYAGALGHTFMALLRGALLHGRGVPEARSRPTVAPFEQRRR